MDATCRWSTLHKNIQLFSYIDPFDTQISPHLFSETETVIGQNKSRDLFLPIAVAVCKKK